MFAHNYVKPQAVEDVYHLFFHILKPYLKKPGVFITGSAPSCMEPLRVMNC
jgi:hypothetical protein